jgi:hypothetical protein
LIYGRLQEGRYAKAAELVARFREMRPSSPAVRDYLETGEVVCNILIMFTNLRDRRITLAHNHFFDAVAPDTGKLMGSF